MGLLREGDALTPKTQRIAIATACGWGRPYEEGVGYRPMTNAPDYLNDLNAMHEAEKILTVGQRVTYASQLCLIWTGHTDRAVPIWFWIEATARQRAEAFLRTLKLWEETP